MPASIIGFPIVIGLIGLILWCIFTQPAPSTYSSQDVKNAADAGFKAGVSYERIRGELDMSLLQEAGLCVYAEKVCHASANSSGGRQKHRSTPAKDQK